MPPGAGEKIWSTRKARLVTALLRISSAHAGFGAEARIWVERDLAPWVGGLIADLQRSQPQRDGPPGQRPGAGANGRGPEVLVERRDDGSLLIGRDPGKKLV